MIPATAIDLLILVESDPRYSPRPAEAIRLAAGLGGGETPRVSLGLRGAAINLLFYEEEDLLDDHLFRQCLPIIAGWRRPVLIDAGLERIQHALGYAFQLEMLTMEQWSHTITTCRYALRF